MFRNLKKIDAAVKIQEYPGVSSLPKELLNEGRRFQAQALRSAFGYYKTNLEEIDLLIMQHEGLAEEHVHKKHHFLRRDCR